MAGLRLFDEKNGKVSECPFVAPKGEVQALCHDGRGRIWLAGSSVWMVDAKRKIYDFAKLARFGTVSHAIGADSTDASGVIVALGYRGVLFVRAEEADR
jgi:ligand-binding sensor domain-containing protein